MHASSRRTLGFRRRIVALMWGKLGKAPTPRAGYRRYPIALPKVPPADLPIFACRLSHHSRWAPTNQRRYTTLKLLIQPRLVKFYNPVGISAGREVDPTGGEMTIVARLRPVQQCL